MKHTTVHIDCFSVGLDDLPRKKQADHTVVLDVLRQAGRFSAFEASATPTIARTMDDLIQSGRITTDNESVGYPWTLVTHIDGKPLKPTPTT